MASFRELPPTMNILLAVLLAALVVGAGLYMPGSPIQGQREAITAAAAEIAKLEPQVQGLQQAERQQAELKAQVAGLEKQLEVLRTIVPEEKDVDEFIRMVHASAASSNVEVRRITSKAVITKEFHNELPFEIQFDGPYYAVMSFFAKLGRLSRIINVSDLAFLSVERAKERGGTKYEMRPGTSVMATCIATTFFTKSDQPEAAAKQQPGKPPAPPAKR